VTVAATAISYSVVTVKIMINTVAAVMEESTKPKFDDSELYGQK
jgi:hypothetical protein